MMSRLTQMGGGRAFRYWRDPLCLASWVAYLLNRFWIKPWLGPEHSFWHGHFNDLLLVPSAIPPLLGLHRLLRLRDHDGPPTLGEVTGHLLFWSFFFEYWGPRTLHYSTGDWWDVAVYWLGAAVAWVWWQTTAKRSGRAVARPAAEPFSKELPENSMGSAP